MTINCCKRSRKRGAQKAFSLVEVAVATAVVLVAFGSVFGVMTMGLSISEASRENLRATQILLDKTEGLRLYSWAQVNNSSYLISSFTNWFFETNNIGLSTAQGYGIQYTGSVSVVPVPFTNSYSPYMVQVTVTVGWQSSGCGWEPGALSHTRSVITYVAEAGMQNYVYSSD